MCNQKLSNISRDIGNCLKRFRRDRNLSQLDLELIAGLSIGTVSRIENGKINPTKETLYRIAEALELNLQDTIQLFAIEVILSIK